MIRYRVGLYAMEAFAAALALLVSVPLMLIALNVFKPHERIVLQPLSSTMIILQFIYVWNDLLIPLVLLNVRDYPTVSIGLYKFFGPMGLSDLGLLFGGIVLALAPIIVLFLGFQRHFVKGLSSGAIKG